MPAQTMPADTVMMSVMHDAMRRDFARLRAALLEEPAPSGRRRIALADHVDFMLTFLDGHHHSEDDKLWPRVRAKNPALGELLDSMVEDHRRIVERATALTRAAAAYRRWDTAPARASLVGRIDGLLEVLLPHLEREETELMPRVAETLSTAEWRAFEREARPELPRSTLAEYLNWFLDGLDEERRLRVTRGIPFPLATLCTVVFGRRYRRGATLRWGADAIVAGRA